MASNSRDDIFVDEQQKLLRNVAEDIKLPLMRILTHIQLAHIQSASADTAYIETTADGALKLLDSYILSTQIYSGQQQLQLQPLSVSALMNDTAQYLSKIAALYDCTLEVRAPHKLQLVMAHTAALQAALISLGYGILNSLQGKPRQKKRIVFTARQSRGLIEAGVFSPNLSLTAADLRMSRNLTGTARQPLPALNPGSNAGILIADILMTAMESEIRVVKRYRGSGLVAHLLPSRQLALL